MDGILVRGVACNGMMGGFCLDLYRQHQSPKRANI